MKTKGWMMAALLIMMMGCLSACKSKEQKAAEAAQAKAEKAQAKAAEAQAKAETVKAA